MAFLGVSAFALMGSGFGVSVDLANFAVFGFKFVVGSGDGVLALVARFVTGLTSSVVDGDSVVFFLGMEYSVRAFARKKIVVLFAGNTPNRTDR